MASALERAATTVAACLVDAPVAPTFSMADVNGWTEEKAYEIARAVLMAVRGVDGLGIEMNWWSERIVAAILNEKDTTND